MSSRLKKHVFDKAGRDLILSRAAGLLGSRPPEIMAAYVFGSFARSEPFGDLDMAVLMAEAGALPPEFSEELVGMGKFSNRLVHLYWEVDDRQVHQLLRERLPDFHRFLRAMANYLGLEDITE